MRTGLHATIVLWMAMGLAGCSLFEESDSPDVSQIDFLFGTEESGRLKKQLNFSGSDDETVNSDIEFIYEDNRLTEKVYHDYLGAQPYILQKDEFIYKNGRLSQMIHYFRTGTTTSPLAVSKIYSYTYPDANTKTEVIYNDEGERRDSVIYSYAGNLLTEEKHYNHLGTWGSKYEYNSKGKLVKITDLASDDKFTVHSFDKKGRLNKTEGVVNGEVKSTAWYEYEIIRNTLVITMFSEDVYSRGERRPSARKTYKNGKLVEYVLYHPTFPGAEWYCNRFEYY
ncbi:MAG: hypothetical protein JW761_02390 [Prolixibacteraceae bacterium]|nr:hypothetical protein [Prolixibacteraceae bacterium]